MNSKFSLIFLDRFRRHFHFISLILVVSTILPWSESRLAETSANSPKFMRLSTLGSQPNKIKIQNDNEQAASDVDRFYTLINQPQHSSLTQPGHVNNLVSKNTRAEYATAIKGHAVALGAENLQSMPGPSIAFQDFAPQMILADANPTSAADMIVGETALFNQPINRYPSNNQGQGVLAQLYIDQFGNQQLGLPQFNPQATQDASRPVHTSSSSDLYRAQQGPIFMSQQIQPNKFGPATNAGSSQSSKASKSVSRLSQKSGLSRAKPSSLSNAQLLALIDELKDFNSHQASKILHVKDKSDKDEDPQKEDDRDNEPDPSTVETKHTESNRKVKPNRKPKIPARGPSGKPNTKELEKFAKFLMTKEGANMRFQLGLEKDSPDDGDDDDDRDTLLESNSKHQKAQPHRGSSLKLNHLERQQSDVASQMERLLENLIGSADEAKKASKSSKKKRVKKWEDDDLRARGRRASNGHFKEVPKSRYRKSAKPKQNNPPAVVAMGPKREENIAKVLIQHELMQDKEEAAAHRQGPRVANKHNELANRDGGDRKGKGGELNDIKTRITDINEVAGNDEVENYPKLARRRDHISLIHELRRVRDDKMSTRSKSDLPFNPITKRALNGELGIRTESHPNGELSLVSSGGSSMRFKLPKDRLGMGNGDNIDENESDSGYEAVSPAFAAPASNMGQVVGKVRLQSEKPVKDEYPISAQVGEKLNKLSDSLDRYFNDGFMKEIETKGQLDEASNSTIKPDASNVVEKGSKKSVPLEPSESQGDKDFDVDVGVDGKRDAAEKDNDDYGDEGDDGDDERSKKNRRQVVESKNKEKDSSRRSKVGMRSEVEGIKKRRGKRIHEYKPSFSKRDQLVQRNLSAGNERLTFEGHSDQRSRPDPVEAETMDSPIGPDGDSELNPELRDTNERVESSRESNNIMTQNGKKVKAKFYEEPEWK